MKKRKYKLWDIFYIMSAHSISTLRSCRVENCPMSHNMSQANPFFKRVFPFSAALVYINNIMDYVGQGANDINIEISLQVI